MISSTGLFALGVLFSVQGQIPILGAEVGIGLDRTVDPSSYLIGPGDVISVVVEGGCTPYMLSAGLLPLAEYTVSTDGVLAVSGIGQIRAAGLTLSGLENELSILARATYPSSSIGVSLVEARLVKVTITGTVVRPGGYTLSAVQRVSALVDSAQSFSAYSSRIGRMLVEGQNEIEVNLLINPETGRPFSDPYLTNGAVVEFSPCLDPVYVLIGNRSGMGIPRTATVETVDLYRPTDLESFLSRMGGVGGHVDLHESGVLRNGAWTPLWEEGEGYPDFQLSVGDTLWLERLTETVTVSGAVPETGIYPFDASVTVEEYVAWAGGVLSTGRLGGTKVIREGDVIASGSEALSMTVYRGDVIEVPYNWVTVNAPWIALAVSVVSVSVAIYNAGH